MTGGATSEAHLAAQTGAGILLFQNLFKMYPASLELFSFKNSPKFDQVRQFLSIIQLRAPIEMWIPTFHSPSVHSY